MFKPYKNKQTNERGPGILYMPLAHKVAQVGLISKDSQDVEAVR